MLRQKTNSIIFLWLIIVILCFYIFSRITGIVIGYSGVDPFFPNGLVFIFFHVSFFHLVFNILALFSIMKEVKGENTSVVLSIIIGSYLSNLLALSFFSQVPSVGVSGIFCGFLGFLAVNRWFYRKRIVFCIESLGMIIFSVTMPNVSFECHISGLISGALIGLLTIIIYFLKKEYRE